MGSEGGPALPASSLVSYHRIEASHFICNIHTYIHTYIHDYMHMVDGCSYPSSCMFCMQEFLQILVCWMQFPWAKSGPIAHPLVFLRILVPPLPLLNIVNVVPSSKQTWVSMYVVTPLGFMPLQIECHHSSFDENFPSYVIFGLLSPIESTQRVSCYFYFLRQVCRANHIINFLRLQDIHP